MKTIWILNHHAIPPQIGGGTRHYDIGRELVKRGYSVYIFASSFIHYQYINLLDEQEKIREESIDGIHWVWMNTREYQGNGKDRILGMVDYYRAMLKNYRQYPRPDIIIGSAVHLLACVAGYRISRKLNTRFISEIRDLWPETLIELGRLKRTGVVARLMFALEKYVYQRSEKIIVTAPGMVEYIAQRGIRKEKIAYLNNGVDVKAFDERSRQFDLTGTPITFDDQKFNVVYLGAIGAANALDTMVDTAKLLMDRGFRDIHFTVVGDGPLTEKLKRKAEEYNLSNFIFFSSIGKQFVPAVLLHSDCLVFSAVDSPLYRFGISANKLFDYMCSARPVIFAINTTNDFIKESGGGISIEPEKPESMANAICEIYQMEESQRKQMGLLGRTFVENNFDISIMVNKLEEVFK